MADYNSYHEQLKQNPNQSRGFGFFGFAYACVILGFYCNQLVSDNAIAEVQCCAVQVTGVSGYFPVECANVGNSVLDVQENYNVSAEFRQVSIWAIALFSMSIAGSLCMCHISTLPAAACLQCLSGCGSFAWLITLTVFVFREQGQACGFVEYDSTSNQPVESILWIAEYTF